MSGQLSLFKGKRQRGTKAPPALEFALHAMVADSLDRWLVPGWLWWHTPSGGKRDIRTAAMLKRLGTKPGIPDILLVEPGRGRLYGLELKRKGETPTDSQKDFGIDLVAAGGWWDWTDDYKKAIALLQQWGALPTTIKVI
jgi:hypothetical protein